MEKTNLINSLTYYDADPDMASIKHIYERDEQTAGGYYNECRDAMNQYVNWWPGKRPDQLKHSVDAKPFQFASDQEVHVISPRVHSLVSMTMNAVREGHVTAAPIGSDDAQRSAGASVFIRWMLDTWIPNSMREIEYSLYNMYLKAFAATWVGWEKKLRRHMELIDLDTVLAESEQGAEIAEMLLDESREDEVVSALSGSYDTINEKELRKALKAFRATGEAQIPVIKNDIDRPVIDAKDPACDVIFPSYTTDPRSIHRCHVREFMTAQDLEQGMRNEDWDADWVENIVEKHMGVSQREIDGIYNDGSAYSASVSDMDSNTATDLVLIVRTYLRLVEEDTGAEGIYELIWCPKTVNDYDDATHGVFRLMNGWDEMPIAITPLIGDMKRLYDSRNLPSLLKGNQRQAKITRDATNDQFSLAANPPRMHPAGRPAIQWGAGADFAARYGEETRYKVMDIPHKIREGVELERFLEDEADRISGLTEDSQVALSRRQYFINRGLEHISEVARIAYKAFQKLYDGDDIYFRVTNIPDPQVFNRGPMDEEMDIKIFYDVRTQDTEFIKETVAALNTVQQNDTTGRIDPDVATDVKVSLILPQYVNRLLRPSSEARADVLRKVANDLALIWSGQSVNAQDTGATIALEYIQQYKMKQTTQLRYTSDEEYQTNLDNYEQEYLFALQQEQNAVIGKQGAPPADLQGIPMA